MKKSISILLSFLLLMSSSGVAYTQHFCGGKEMASSVTLGEKSLSCGMDMPVSTCDVPTNTEEGCCDNEHTAVTTDENFSKTSFHINFQKPMVAVGPVFFIPAAKIQAAHRSFPVAYYNPPPLQRNIPVLYQVFLI